MNFRVASHLFLVIVTTSTLGSLFSCKTGNKETPSSTIDTIAVTRTGFFPKQEVPVTQLPSKENLWVFLMAGQSNMAGRGQVSSTDTLTHPRILTINSKYKWILAKEPLNLFEPNMKGLDCGVAFARELIQSVPDSVSIAVIHCAVGGSSIQQWLGDSLHREVKLLSNFKEKVDFAQQQGTVKGILWHQGESDANEKDIPLYEEKLGRLFIEFREIISNDSLPIIIGELGNYTVPESKQERWDQINEIIHKVASQTPDTYVIDNENHQPKKDNTHLNALSQRMMGIKFARKYLELVLEEVVIF